MRDTRLIIVEGVLVLILTALVRPELVGLGSTAAGDATTPKTESAVIGAASSTAGRDTQIRYVVSRRTRVRLGIFALDGRQVRKLSNTDALTGPHTVAWNGLDDRGRRVAPGVYYFRLSDDDGGDRNTLIVVDR